jgi:hypothetical protein
MMGWIKRLHEKVASRVREATRIAPRPGVWNRYPRLAHYAHEGAPIALVVLIASNWLPKAHGALQETAVFVFSIVWMLFMLGGLYHLYFLCEKCISKFPLNGPEMAVKRRKQLYSAHFRLKWYTASFIAFALSGALGERLGLSRFWDNVLITIFLAPQPYWFARIFSAHSKLQPWCEYCDNGGGGGGKQETPDPSPSELVPA